MEWVLFTKVLQGLAHSGVQVFIARGWSGVGERIDSYRLEGKRLCLRISTGENVSA
jgi:hypothetical protein